MKYEFDPAAWIWIAMLILMAICGFVYRCPRTIKRPLYIYESGIDTSEHGIILKGAVVLEGDGNLLGREDIQCFDKKGNNWFKNNHRMTQ